MAISPDEEQEEFRAMQEGEEMEEVAIGPSERKVSW